MIKGENVEKKESGVIVASQIASIPKSDRNYGYIIIETQDNEYMKVKVDAMTNYETLERGEQVTVHYDVLGKTNILSAKKIIRRNHEPSIAGCSDCFYKLASD